MNVDSAAHILQQQHGQPPAQVLAEFIQTVDHAPLPALVEPVERGVVDAELQAVEHPQDLLGDGEFQQAGARRVERIERHADGHGRRVRQLIVGHRLELVGRPVAEIQRPAGAGFKRITTTRDVPRMEQRGTLDADFQDFRIEGGEQLEIRFDP